MAKWGEIKCPRCSAPPMSLWESMGRSLEEGDAREARLEARIEELEAKLAQQDDLVQAAVAAALAEQRERDAKVADLHVDGEDSYGPDFDAGWEAAAFAIAAAIRKGGE